MRWLITGGAGFIGSHIVDAILDRGLGDVVVLDNFSRGRMEHLDHHLGSDRLRIINGDIRCDDDIQEACRGIHTVLHLAAWSNVMGAEAAIKHVCDTNVAGTLSVLSAALHAGVDRVVFASSREVYGDPDNLPVNEASDLRPKNLYGASKVAGETYCTVFRSRGLDVRVLRLANVYGLRDTGRVIPIWLEKARNGEDLEVFGGDQVLDLVWIDHVVEAFLTAGMGRPLQGPVNVASGQGVAIRQLAEWILAATQSASRLVVLPKRDQEVVGFVADVSQMRRELCIAPPSPPPRYLKRMLDQWPVGVPS